MAAPLDRRKVTMRTVALGPTGQTLVYEATDHVAVEHIPAFVADARTRWQYVEVGTETDHGPGGEDGDYNHPEHLQKGISLEEHLESLGINHDNDGQAR